MSLRHKGRVRPLFLSRSFFMPTLHNLKVQTRTVTTRLQHKHNHNPRTPPPPGKKQKSPLFRHIPSPVGRASVLHHHARCAAASQDTRKTKWCLAQLPQLLHVSLPHFVPLLRAVSPADHGLGVPLKPCAAPPQPRRARNSGSKLLKVSTQLNGF